MSAEMTSCDESPREFLTKTYKLKKEFYLPFSWILVSLCAPRNSPLSFSVLISGRLEHARLFCFAGGFCATHKQNTYSGFMSFLSSLRLLLYGFYGEFLCSRSATFLLRNSFSRSKPGSFYFTSARLQHSWKLQI